MSDYKKQWIDEFRNFSRRSEPWTAFSDWCFMIAAEFSNTMDPTATRAERAEQYQRIREKYTKEEMLTGAKMLVHLVDELDERATTVGYQDVLGEIFHELDVQNKYKAQFFTPNSISALMGELAMADDVKRARAAGDYISMNDPACGSGSTIYGGLNAVQKYGGNPCKDVLVYAGDVDQRCVNMAYIQLSLYGIPAVVMQQNALTLDKPDVWYTPVYRLDGWQFRRRHETIKADADNATVQLSLFGGR